MISYKMLLKKLNKKAFIFTLVVIILLLGVFYKLSYENIQNDTTELKEQDPSINPRIYDRRTGQIMDASDFVELPIEIYPANGGNPISNYGTIDKLDDGYNGDMGLNYNMCSKACCSPQYPPPFAVEEDVMVNSMKDKFVPNNYACNNAWNNAGCVCMTKKQHDYIGSRGGNASSCNA